MKILKDIDFEKLERDASLLDAFRKEKYWFTAYPFLDPIFKRILGEQPFRSFMIEDVRASFEEKLEEYMGGVVPQKKMRIMELESTIVGLQESMRPLLEEWERLKKSEQKT